uniref:Variant surface glycoprotein 1105 n=1 Tax=Trypanosoma brucei TaxID=5691 RepID=M4TAS5_9TRYP|nr:variant surface glycoprotein 1105 [Trypanosoma brucei]
MTVHVATFYITATLLYATTGHAAEQDTESAKQESACSSEIYLHSLQKSFAGRSVALIAELYRLLETQNVLTLATSTGSGNQRHGANALAAVVGKRITALATKSQTCTAKANEVIALLSLQAGQHLAYDALSKLATPTAEGNAVSGSGGSETKDMEATLTGLTDTTCIDKKTTDLTAGEQNVNLAGLHTIRTYKLQQKTGSSNADKKFCAAKCDSTCGTATNWNPAILAKTLLQAKTDRDVKVRATGKSNANETPKASDGNTEPAQQKRDLEWRAYDFLNNKYCEFDKLDLGTTARSKSDETIRRVMLAATQGASTKYDPENNGKKATIDGLITETFGSDKNVFENGFWKTLKAHKIYLTIGGSDIKNNLKDLETPENAALKAALKQFLEAKTKSCHNVAAATKSETDCEGSDQAQCDNEKCEFTEGKCKLKEAEKNRNHKHHRKKFICHSQGPSFACSFDFSVSLLRIIGKRFLLSLRSL